jgi:hypothetical protein
VIVQYAAGTIAVLAYLTVAVVLAVHRPWNAVGWIFAATGVVLAATELLWAVMLSALAAEPPRLDVAALVAWAQPIFGTTLWNFLAFLLFLLFPDGRPISERWRRLVWVQLVAIAVMAAGFAFSPGPLVIRAALENPFGLEGPAGTIAQVARVVGLVSTFSLGVVAASCALLRYRRGGHVERQQLKWFAFGSLLFSATSVFYVLTIPIQEAVQRFGDVAWVLLCVAAALLPLAATIGILRYGLFDIDRILSGTFVYGALTAILSGLYTASVRLFNWLFAELTGTESEMALVLTTLLLATTFTPIKKRLEAIVERRYRDEDEVDEGLAKQPLPQSRDELTALIREIVAEDRRRR